LYLQSCATKYDNITSVNCYAIGHKNSNAYLLDPETRILFLFARCRPTQRCCCYMPLLLVVLLCIGNLMIKN